MLILSKPFFAAHRLSFHVTFRVPTRKCLYGHNLQQSQSMHHARRQLTILFTLTAAICIFAPASLSASTDSAVKAIKNTKVVDGTPTTRHKKKRKAPPAPAPVLFFTPTSAGALSTDIASLLDHAAARRTLGRHGHLALARRHALLAQCRHRAPAGVEHEALHQRARARSVRPRAPVPHRGPAHRRHRPRRHAARRSRPARRRRSGTLTALRGGRPQRAHAAPRTIRLRRRDQARHGPPHRRRERLRSAAHPRRLETALSAAPRTPRRCPRSRSTRT